MMGAQEGSTIRNEAIVLSNVVFDRVCSSRYAGHRAAAVFQHNAVEAFVVGVGDGGLDALVCIDTAEEHGFLPTLTHEPAELLILGPHATRATLIEELVLLARDLPEWIV